LRSVGEAAVLEALKEVWTRVPPAETCAGEIGQLAPELRTKWGDVVPLFNEVLDFELDFIDDIYARRHRRGSGGV
jgi:hypothetical protein